MFSNIKFKILVVITILIGILRDFSIYNDTDVVVNVLRSLFIIELASSLIVRLSSLNIYSYDFRNNPFYERKAILCFSLILMASLFSLFLILGFMEINNDYLILLCIFFHSLYKYFSILIQLDKEFFRFQSIDFVKNSSALILFYLGYVELFYISYLIPFLVSILFLRKYYKYILFKDTAVYKRYVKEIKANMFMPVQSILWTGIYIFDKSIEVFERDQILIYIIVAKISFTGVAFLNSIYLVPQHIMYKFDFVNSRRIEYFSLLFSIMIPLAAMILVLYIIPLYNSYYSFDSNLSFYLTFLFMFSLILREYYFRFLIASFNANLLHKIMFLYSLIICSVIILLEVNYDVYMGLLIFFNFAILAFVKMTKDYLVNANA